MGLRLWTWSQTGNVLRVIPLNDAPYAAVYEEQEVLASFHDYIKMVKEAGLPDHITLLLSEYIRYVLHRASFYYPPLIDRKMMVEKPKTGEIEKEAWIPLEDLQDGWKQSGEVGQEVYGAGLPFTVVPRHYKVLNDQRCIVFVDYPSDDPEIGADGSVSFRITGHPAMFCRMRLLPLDGLELPDVRVMIGGGGQRATHGQRRPGVRLPRRLHGPVDIL